MFSCCHRVVTIFSADGCTLAKCCSDSPFVHALRPQRRRAPQISSKHVLGNCAPTGMSNDTTLQWLSASRRRRRLLAELDQPMTAQQLHPRTHLSRRDCSDVLQGLQSKGLVTCLNPASRRSRLYGLTREGQRWRKHFWPELPDYGQPKDIDWQVHGELCFRHREAVVRVIDDFMQPATMKRRARYADPSIRMSANNVRDLVPELCRLGVLEPVFTRKAHRHYRLTPLGKACRVLLQRARDAHSRLTQQQSASTS